MRDVFLTVLICIFNIFMWIIFLKKFKKIFSTDGIIASTREELNRMIDDINRNTAQDLKLINDKIKEAEKIIAEAEKRLGVLNSDLTQKEKSSDFMQIIRNEKRNDETANLQNIEEQSYFSSNKRNPVEKYMQQQSFSQKTEVSTPVEDVVTKEIVEEKTSMPSVSYSTEQIRPKEEFSDKVKKLYDQGFDVETIATELNSSTIEVQLIIDMNF